MKRVFLLGFSVMVSLSIWAQQRGMYVVADNGASVMPPPQEKRYALVIGNNAYQHITKLRNAVSDANLMSSSLQSVGFEVETVTNGTRNEIVAALRRLGKRASGQHTVALFYYSGHGLQVRDENWLVPVDALAETQADVADACVGLSSVTSQLEQANSGTNLVILDACRNNPFPYGRNTGGGLTAPKQVPSGTYIAFSTAPNTTASDGSGSNSPYTLALSKAVQMPNLEIEKAFKRIRVEVKTSGQTPWENSSLEGEFYFKPQQIVHITPMAQPIPQYQPPAPHVEPTPVSRPTESDFIETTTGVSFTMKFITGNSFQMGNNDGSDDEKPVHMVNLDNFFMSKYEVTNDEFCTFLNEKGNHHEGSLWLGLGTEDNYDIVYSNNSFSVKSGRGRRPVRNVTWYAATAYCVWLSQKTSKKYRLPTEAEWEYAARGGQPYKFSGSNNITDIAWVDENSGGTTHEVGTKQSNGFGLYDMSGNVGEWCSDLYDSYKNSNSPRQNNTDNSMWAERVTRGGCWRFGAFQGSSTYRSKGPQRYSCDYYGFRLCSTL